MFLSTTRGYFYLGYRGANQDYHGATSNRREILLDLYQNAKLGTFKIRLTGATVVDGNFQATLNPANFAADNKFLNYVAEGGSINDFSAAFNVISPGDYVIQPTWTDIDGTSRSRPLAEGAPGEIWSGSSQGPTHDGRLGIDFVAPGEVIFSPYSPNTYYSNFRFNMVQGGNSLYGIQTAVSAAAPLSTGVIALMLQLDPSLTNQEIKEILQQTAREDSFTGPVPNITFGYGKLDALAALQKVNELLSTKDYALQKNSRIFPNPVKDIVTINSKVPIESIDIISIDGKRIMHINQPDTHLDLSDLKNGMYFLKVYTSNRTEILKVLKSN